MRADRRVFTIFWAAVVLDVFALGVAWSAWKSLDASPFAWVVAVPATLVCLVATLVAARVLVVVSRIASRRAPSRRVP